MVFVNARVEPCGTLQLRAAMRVWSSVAVQWGSPAGKRVAANVTVRMETCLNDIEKSFCNSAIT
jgi:hypothetical protein